MMYKLVYVQVYHYSFLYLDCRAEPLHWMALGGNFELSGQHDFQYFSSFEAGNCMYMNYNVIVKSSILSL